MRIVIPVSLDDEKDADLIDWLNSQPNKSAAIREAVRAKLAGGITLADIYREIKSLKNGSFVPAPSEPKGEMEEAAANLDKLLGL